jgi:dTDP-L-rhamnose 4-epimerase
MRKHILITGGAGFIGSHLADALLRGGHRVRALDSLSRQVHGSEARRPAYLDPEVELLVGDVCDPAAVHRALKGIDGVYHFAASVGVGQSMYEVTRYTATNNLGTAVLLEALMEHPVERLVIASSMSIYGEGLYRTDAGRPVHNAQRSLEQLRGRDWEPRGRQGEPVTPVPTTEDKAPSLSSVYALSKYDQERLCLMIGQAYGIPTVALRVFNVYGPRQALSNPYTGALAIFAARLLNGKPPLIFEDGQQRRDFVSVYDVAQACCRALEVNLAGTEARVFNVGSGRAHTVCGVAAALAAVLGKHGIPPEVTGRYRVGDIRHCFADISLARQVLGYEPRVNLAEGLTDLASWLEGQAATDRVGEAREELAQRGLTA